MYRRWVILLVALAGVGVAPPARGQEPLPLAQSPADSAGIALDLAQQLRSQGKRDLAEALFQLILDRYPHTPAAGEARTQLDALKQARRVAGGTATLAAWGALYGAWLGIAVPAAFGAEEPSPYGAGILLGVPSGFFAARSYARTARLTGGQARAVSFGSLWGTFQGAGWREVFGIGDRTYRDCPPPGISGPCYEYRDQSDRAPFAAMIVGGGAGIATAALLARSREMSGATVSAVQWGSLWGTWFGAASAAALDVRGEHAPLTWTLVGGNAGLIATALLAPRWNLDGGRPWLVSAAGIAGLVAGLGVDLLFEIESDRTVILMPLLGSAVGLAAGVGLTRPREPAAGGEPGSPGALLRLRQGRLSTGDPALQPALMPALEPGGGVRQRVGVRVPLVSVALP